MSMKSVTSSETIVLHVEQALIALGRMTPEQHEAVSPLFYLPIEKKRTEAQMWAALPQGLKDDPTVRQFVRGLVDAGKAYEDATDEARHDYDRFVDNVERFQHRSKSLDCFFEPLHEALNKWDAMTEATRSEARRLAGEGTTEDRANAPDKIREYLRDIETAIAAFNKLSPSEQEEARGYIVNTRRVTAQ